MQSAPRDVPVHPVVHAVIVSYRPDLGKLQELLDALAPQVQGVVIVDNGSPAPVLEWLRTRHSPSACQVVFLGNNFGIARAQNAGIDIARQSGSNYVILFDQDSGPAADMVGKLLAAARRQEDAGMRVAGVGPNYLDTRQGNPPPFIKVSGMRVVRQPCPDCDAVVEVDYLIASGCLIPMATLDEVGGMHEELFIDYVDIEWGLRARSKGYQSYGVCGAMMGHDLGDEPIDFLGRRYPNHSALRHYYHFRNAMWLYRQRWLPLQWRLGDGWRLLLKFGFYALFAKPRHEHLRMMVKGLAHGFIGRLGRVD